MTYFGNITSLSWLKKQYRTLALANHPDRGGSTAAMQRINTEFGKLYRVREHDTTAPGTATGYGNDYTGATARQTKEKFLRAPASCGRRATKVSVPPQVAGDERQKFPPRRGGRDGA